MCYNTFRVNRMTASQDEESPSIAGQECRLITGEGDFKESATEIYRTL